MQGGGEWGGCEQASAAAAAARDRGSSGRIF